jgi:hypothetical protein
MQMGNGNFIVFIISTMFIVLAASSLVTAGLAGQLLGIQLPPFFSA